MRSSESAPGPRVRPAGSGRWVPLAAIGALLTAAAIAASSGRPAFSPSGAPAPSGGGRVPSPSPPVLKPRFSSCPPRCDAFSQIAGPLTALAVLAIVVLAVAVVTFAIVMFIRAAGQAARQLVPLARADEERPDWFQPAPGEITAALDAGLTDLSDLDADPRRAVIACWVRLEQAASRAGTPRLAGDAPADLVSRLLAAHHVDSAVLAGFADLYRRARYARHTVDERMREAAVTALRQVRTELGRAGRDDAAHGVPAGDRSAPDTRVAETTR